MRRTNLLLWTVLLGAMLLAGGCAREPFTRVNYETVYLGQVADEVEATLGAPDRVEGSRWVYIHRQPFYQAIIAFDEGRVVSKQWSWDRPRDDTGD
ncbi:MAG: hypothetical protein ACLFV7_02835 [Phycisphaerae bacterium]